MRDQDERPLMLAVAQATYGYFCRDGEGRPRVLADDDFAAIINELHAREAGPARNIVDALHAIPTMVMPTIQTSIETVRRAHEGTLAELSACQVALTAALAQVREAEALAAHPRPAEPAADLPAPRLYTREEVLAFGEQCVRHVAPWPAEHTASRVAALLDDDGPLLPGDES